MQANSGSASIENCRELAAVCGASCNAIAVGAGRRCRTFAHSALSTRYGPSMAGKRRIDVRLATQILVLQVVIVTLTLVVAFGLFAVFNRQRLDSQYHVHALDIARVVASSPTVINNISRYDDAALTASPALVDELAAGPIQSVASRVEQRTHVRFVVVANRHGIRLADPERNRLGFPVLADISAPPDTR